MQKKNSSTKYFLNNPFIDHQFLAFKQRKKNDKNIKVFKKKKNKH